MSNLTVWPEAKQGFGQLHRKAVAALEQNLAPDEAVGVVVVGPSNQAIIGTQRRAFVYKKGFMAGASFGAEMTEWNYRGITGVQLHTGMMSGAVIIQGSGQSGHKTSYWGQGDSDPYKAPNAIPVVRPFDVAQQAVSVLRKLIDDAQNGVAPSAPVVVQHAAAPPAPAAADDRLIADQLRQLADMHAAGVLDQTEFAAAKARLLGL